MKTRELPLGPMRQRIVALPDPSVGGRFLGWPSRASVCRLASSRIGLLCAVLCVTAQMIVNFHAGRISDLRSLYFTHHLAQHPLPYLDVKIEYPVLTGAFMTVAAALTHGLGSYLTISSVGLGTCAVGSTCVLWSLSRRAAWCFALCPLLLIYSLLNWDLLAIFLMLLGWRAFTRERYASSGAWLALGTFAKLYPACLLVFCVVGLVRRRRSGQATKRDLRRFLGLTAGVSMVINLPFMIPAFHNWLYFWSFNTARNEHADLLSWLGPLSNASLSTTNAVLAAAVIAAGACGAVAIWRGARVAHVAASVFFVCMLMQKVYSPQYTLWLVAFALIADWEPWAIGVLSIVGLVDYANAVIHIALVARHASFVHWDENHIFPLNQGLRLLTTLIVGLLMTYRGAHAQPHEPVLIN